MPMSPRLLRPRSAGGGFDPRRISGLQAWYDFSDSSTLTIDTGITSVRDKSGNSLTASEAVGANQPLLVANARNGLSAADFDGTNDKLTTASIAADITQFTAFMVLRPDTLGGGGLGRVWTRNDVSRAMGMFSGNRLRVWMAATTLVDTADNALPNGSWAYIRGRWSGASDLSGISSAVNGVEVVGAASSFVPTSVASSALCVGNRASDGARGFDGLMGEFLLYSRALTASEVAEVENGIKAKWGFA